MSTLQPPSGAVGAETTPFFSENTVPWGWRERAGAFALDSRAHKIDLGAGVIRRDSGRPVSYRAVYLGRKGAPPDSGKGYLPPLGFEPFRECAHELLLGEHATAVRERSFTVQSIGGACALRLGGDLLARTGLYREIWVSNESWADHGRIFERAGLSVRRYPYLNGAGNGVDLERMLAGIELAAPRSAILLQLSCHNPTGFDPSNVGWERILGAIQERGHLPFFDIAYAGLGSGLQADLAPLRLAVSRGVDFLAATSFCKLLSLNDARVGTLSGTVVSAEVARRLESQIKIDIQSSYSSPPFFGAAVIDQVLRQPDLRAMWLEEMELIRRSLVLRRGHFVNLLLANGADQRVGEIRNQRGIFAWTGLPRESCARLVEREAIYLPSNGRLCLGALPLPQIERVAKAVAAEARSDRVRTA